MKEYIEKRAISIANYITESNATMVRQTAKEFGISKSTAHMIVTKWNGFVDGEIIETVSEDIEESYLGCFAIPDNEDAGVKNAVKSRIASF